MDCICILTVSTSNGNKDFKDIAVFHKQCNCQNFGKYARIFETIEYRGIGVLTMCPYNFIANSSMQ